MWLEVTNEGKNVKDLELLNTGACCDESDEDGEGVSGAAKHTSAVRGGTLHIGDRPICVMIPGMLYVFRK